MSTCFGTFPRGSASALCAGLHSIFLCLALAGCTPSARLLPTVASTSDLGFDALAGRWDEGIPLGNATIGALVWEKDGALRLSLDRTDLWDERPCDSLSGDRYRFSWVKAHIRSGNYAPVQRKFDAPYDLNAAPCKIPGAAIEFPLSQLGRPCRVRLSLGDALCEARWPDGVQMQTFVHATRPVGWFVFKGVGDDFEPRLVMPQYGQRPGEQDGASSIRRLGYRTGRVERRGNMLVCHQEGYGGFSYDVAVCWTRCGDVLTGTWSVTSSKVAERAEAVAGEALSRGLSTDYKSHRKFWVSYHGQSGVTVPDSVIQKQYDNEMYKFGAASREDSYPISLQAVWTADDGTLPPWKGDYHHDLNTELSYWPAYTGNRLSEGLGFLNTLWRQRDVYKRYTRQYFETGGMNVPGVCTLSGEPMGGWIQYAMSQTVGAWLAQHFYLHWKYAADGAFLKKRAYPFAKDVATYLEQQSAVGADGKRRLEFSSSPEINDNALQAWFTDMTNFDLSLMRFIYGACAEMADSLRLPAEARHWRTVGAQLPGYDVDTEGALTFAKGYPYNTSHRHFSHAMAIHPLGLIDWEDGPEAQRTITATLKRLKDCGPDYWTGYSYSWYACLQARARNGEEAVRALRTFAECFCLPNTFHANGDQSGTGKSRFTYRPFTLEGNFAFAAGVHEMLLQSHTGVIRIFPAVPAAWRDVSFERLRARGGFLVTAERRNGRVTRLSVRAERGGLLRIVSPVDGCIHTYNTRPGQRLDIIK